MGVIRDFVWSTVQVAPSPATTGLSLGVQTGDGDLFADGGFPKKCLLVPPGVMPSRLNAERILVTGRSGDTLNYQSRDAGNYNGGTGRNVQTGWVIMNTPFADDFFNMSIVTNETPAGLINSSNTAYTVAGIFRTGSLKVYLNGQRLKSGSGNDYVELANGTGFTMQYAPDTDDVLTVDYEIGDTTLNVGGNSYVSDEAVTGTQNGTNPTFTTARAYISTTLEVYVNGAKQVRGTDFNETTPGSGIFTFVGDIPTATDTIRVAYQFNLNPSSNADTVDGAHASVTPVQGVVPITDSNNFVLANIYRNLIINGGCEVAQRVTAPNLSTTSQYGKVDRFRVHGAGTAVSAGTVNQSVGASIGVSGYSLHVAAVTLTGSGQLFIKHRIEARDAVTLKNQLASFSAAVYHDTGVSVNYVITIRKPTAADNFAAVTDIATSGNLPVANNAASTIKLENVSMGDCSNGIEIEIRIDCGAVTSKNFHLTEFQFNRGARALTFQARRFVEELLECQRYYEKSYSYAVAPGTTQADLMPGTATHRDNGGANTHNVIIATFKVTKRAVPTMKWYDPINGNGTTHAHGGGSTGTTYTAPFSSGATDTDAYYMVALTSGDFHLGSCWVAEAEL